MENCELLNQGNISLDSLSNITFIVKRHHFFTAIIILILSLAVRNEVMTIFGCEKRGVSKISTVIHVYEMAVKEEGRGHTFKCLFHYKFSDFLLKFIFVVKYLFIGGLNEQNVGDIGMILFILKFRKN